MRAVQVIRRTVPVVVLVVACGQVAAAQVHFTNVATSAGLGGELYLANTFHGLGAAWIDVNHDDWPDLFCVNGKNKTSNLYLSQANGTFVLRNDLLPPLPNVEKPGAVFADYDNDGDDDIYIITDNEVNSLTGLPSGNPQDGPPNLLLKNLWVELGSVLPPPGQPLFQEIAQAAGVDDLPPTPFPSVTGSNYPGYRAVAAGWLDYDRDGWIDLVVGHWSCANLYAPSNWDRLFHNKGDGTFEDATVAVGLPGPADEAGLRPTLTMIGAQLDQDFWPDIYFGNVSCGAPGEPATLDYDTFQRNTGLGTFHDATPDSPGLGDDAANAMGVAVSDVENDGDWDLYVTDIYDNGLDSAPLGNPLYVNDGDGTFLDNTAPAAGVDGDTSWPTNFFDADDDGDEDLFIGCYGGLTPLSRFWTNDGTGLFTDISAASGVQDPSKRAYGSATCDYDRDGDVDLLVVNGQSGRLSLLRNDSTDSNHWLGIKLVATSSNRSAIGAVVKARAGALHMMRQVLGGSSAHSQDALSRHFGLGSATTVDSVEVFWPSGLVSYLTNVPADQYLTVTEEAQYFAAYGKAGSGGATYAPSLTLSGSAAPGGAFAIDIASAQGGGLVFLILGLPQVPPFTVKTCPLHIQFPLTLILAGATTGTSNGHGNYHLPAVIPPTAVLVTVALQAFIMSPSLPKGASSTNGVTLSILP